MLVIQKKDIDDDISCGKRRTKQTMPSPQPSYLVNLYYPTMLDASDSEERH